LIRDFFFAYIWKQIPLVRDLLGSDISFGFPSSVSYKNELTATHTITAIKAFVTSSASHGNMTTGVTGRSITLHASRSCVHCIKVYRLLLSFYTLSG
jgi:hypothetical protein